MRWELLGPDQSSKKNRLFFFSLIGLSLALHIFNLVKTGPFQRTHDAGDHLAYVRTVSAGEWLPPANACFECYHPPVYYWSAALVEKGILFTGARSSDKGLQAYSVAAFIAFLLFGWWIIRQSLIEKGDLILAGLFFLFWPSGFFHSVRIGNDSLFYLFHGAALWGVLDWMQKGGRRSLALTLISSTLSLFTKANGFITLAMVGLTVAWVMWNEPPRRKMNWAAAVWTVVTLFSAYRFFVWLMALRGNVSSNAQDLVPGLRVGNSLSLIFGFSPSLYFNTPFYHAGLDETGRQIFSIVVLKSSLWGEWATEIPGAVMAARGAGILILPVLIVCLIGLWCGRKQWDRFPLIANAVLMIIGLAAYRWHFPYSTSANFRYIYPIVISGAVFFADGVRYLQIHGGRFWSLAAQLIFGGFIISGLCAVIWF